MSLLCTCYFLYGIYHTVSWMGWLLPSVLGTSWQAGGRMEGGRGRYGSWGRWSQLQWLLLFRVRLNSWKGYSCPKTLDPRLLFIRPGSSVKTWKTKIIWHEIVLIRASSNVHLESTSWKLIWSTHCYLSPKYSPARPFARDISLDFLYNRIILYIDWFICSLKYHLCKFALFPCHLQNNISVFPSFVLLCRYVLCRGDSAEPGGQ